MRSDPTATARLREWGALGGNPVATTEVNFFEVAVGIELAEGRERREHLGAAWAQALLAVEVIPLTRRATLEAVRRQAHLYRAGKPSSLGDLLVAAIAKVGGCDAIVTRDTDDFERVGLLPVERH